MDTLTLIRLPETLKLCAQKRASFYAALKSGLYPPAISIGARSVAWVKAEVEAVLKARIAGKSEEEIRILVNKLKENRKKLAA